MWPNPQETVTTAQNKKFSINTIEMSLTYEGRRQNGPPL